MVRKARVLEALSILHDPGCKGLRVSFVWSLRAWLLITAICSPTVKAEAGMLFPSFPCWAGHAGWGSSVHDLCMFSSALAWLCCLLSSKSTPKQYFYNPDNNSPIFPEWNLAFWFPIYSWVGWLVYKMNACSPLRLGGLVVSRGMFSGSVPEWWVAQTHAHVPCEYQCPVNVDSYSSPGTGLLKVTHSGFNFLARHSQFGLCDTINFKGINAWWI